MPCKNISLIYITILLHVLPLLLADIMTMLTIYIWQPNNTIFSVSNTTGVAGLLYFLDQLRTSDFYMYRKKLAI